jgi:hypothetical protein
MKRLVTALVTVLLILAVPVVAEHRQDSYADIVKWAGCEANLVTSDERQIIESFYSPGKHTLYIGTRDVEGLPQSVAVIVLYHEIGHCLQAQSGLLTTWLPRIYLELDADRWAADLACARHLDGKRMLHDIMVWAYKTYGYEGDYDHGTLAQRIAQGDNALMCRLPRIEAPLVTR